MNRGRMEAFSDGVIAILITIMVFDIKPPAGADWDALISLVPILLTYLMSFLYLGTYWSNHHHMLQMTERVNGAILWANLHLLFWLSLLPFTTHWIRSSEFSSLPTAVYGVVLLFSALSYFILQHTIIRFQGQGSRLAAAVGTDFKGKLSLNAFLAGVGLAFLSTPLSLIIYASVALLWLVPDRRIESRLVIQDDAGKP